MRIRHSKKFRTEFYTHFDKFNIDKDFIAKKKFMLEYDDEIIEIHNTLKILALNALWVIAITVIVLAKMGMTQQSIISLLIMIPTYLYFRFHKKNEILSEAWKELTIEVSDEEIVKNRKI